MNKELELWQFIAERLQRDETVMLLVTAESSGSSPGRQGYKMAVGADGELCGSIGGGVMEVSLVEQAKIKSKDAKGKNDGDVSEQVHRKGVPNSSGMICSGKQTVIFKLLTPESSKTIESIIESLQNRRPTTLFISPHELGIGSSDTSSRNFKFQKYSDDDFVYQEKLGFKNVLFILGGGHCALALSELMSKMDFHISIFDDRPDLNTIEKNRYAHEINIIDGYDNIRDKIPSGQNVYVVVMTLGYAFDKLVIQKLLDKEFNYFGVLGSRAKIATLMKELKSEGFPPHRLDRIHTPIGLPINSRTPEEIAVSIAAEIISIKNRA